MHHITDRAEVRGRRAVVALFQRREADPHRVAGTRERHIQQAQVFAMALLVGGRDMDIVQRQVQSALAIGIAQVDKGRSGLGDATKVVGKGQKHQRVFQALGLVHGHDLDQIGIAFEPHDLLIAAHGVVAHLLGQPADQRLLAVELRAGGLQQFGQVQEVGEPALAAMVAVGRSAQPTRRQRQQVQRAAQHRQHAERLPHAVQHA